MDLIFGLGLGLGLGLYLTLMRTESAWPVLQTARKTWRPGTGTSACGG